MTTRHFAFVRPTVISAAIISALAGAPAFGQSSALSSTDTGISDTEPQDIVVTGYRSSLAAALQEKRDANAIIDVVKAEDIAKFPDSNLAESLQRVPGVTITRDSGEGRSISVRGLGPDFTRVRIDGMEAQAISSGVDGVNRGRGFDFNVFASELFNSIAVRKTPSAETEEGSLGATVDLQTGRPLDFRHFTLTGSAKGTYSQVGKNFDPRVAGLVADSFAGGTLGFVLSGAYSTSHRVGETSQSGLWDTMASNGGFCDPTDPADICYGQPLPDGVTHDQLTSTSIYHPRYPRVGQYDIDETRLGFTGALEWKPDDRTDVLLEGLYSRQKAERQEFYLTPIGFSTGLSQQGKPEMILREGEVEGDNLVYGLFDNVDLRSEYAQFDYNTTFWQGTLAVKHDFSDRFHANFKVGQSSSDLNQPLELTLQADRINSQGFSYDLRGNPNRPAIDFNFDTMDPDSYYIGPVVTGPSGGKTGPQIRIRPQYVDNRVRQIEVNVEGDVSSNFQLKTGGNYREYRYSGRSLRLASEQVTPALPAGVTNADLLVPFSGLEDFSLPAVTPTSWLRPDPAAFEKVFGIFCNCGDFTLRSDTPTARAGTNAVGEKDFAIYLQGDFNFMIGGVKIRGDAGARYVDTSQSSTGYTEAGVNTQQVTIHRSYDDFLPAANLVIEPTDKLLFRLAASKVMSRPGLGSLTPGGSVSVSGSSRSISTGNPFLDPIRATTFDASAEWYFAPESALSLGYFHKHISSFVQTLRQVLPFSASGLPTSILDGTGLTPDDTFTFSHPLNTKGGPLDGVEVNLQLPFRFLPGSLRNFGMLANYTHVTSNIAYIINSATGETVTDPLTDLSKNTANLTLYYEDKRFSARISGAYRDNFLTYVPARIGGDVEGTKGSLYIDATIGYNLTDHIALSLDGTNLTDEYEEDYDDSSDRWGAYTHYGRQFTAGVRVKF